MPVYSRGQNFFCGRRHRARRRGDRATGGNCRGPRAGVFRLGAVASRGRRFRLDCNPNSGLNQQLGHIFTT